MAKYGGFECLRAQVRAVSPATIDHPPINLFDVPLFLELDRIVTELAADDEVRVIGFQSADPTFIAHADVNWILTLPAEKPPRPTEPNAFVGLMERIRSCPSSPSAPSPASPRRRLEFLLSLDMSSRPARRPASRSPVALGIIPGGGGTQRSPARRPRPRSRSSSAARTSTRRRPRRSAM
jgi:enoyl-CoA hydratase/carnithine racemase